MKKVFNTPSSKDQLHHAYILEGNDSHLPKLLEFIEELFNFPSGHPDVFIHNADMFGVEDAGVLVSKNSQNSVLGNEKIIIATLRSISHQAQNSLLKTLEEPSSGTYIFLISPSSSIFLPTIRSRVHVLEGLLGDNISEKKAEGSSDELIAIKKIAKKFVESEIPDRLEIVKKIMADRSGELIDDRYVYDFVKEVEVLACGNLIGEVEAEGGVVGRGEKIEKASEEYFANRRNNAKIFTEIYEYLYEVSSSKKLILEHLALGLR
jgi:hypothetical protein